MIPAGSLIVFHFLERTLFNEPGWWPLVRGAIPESIGFSSGNFAADQLQLWCWPSPWLVLPFVIWGLALTVHRGWLQWRQQQPPVAWFLTCAALVMFLTLFVQSENPGAALPVIRTSLVVLLLVFLLAELLRRGFERMVLWPPLEEEKMTQGEPVPVVSTQTTEEGDKITT